jgi:hypothetical protein
MDKLIIPENIEVMGQTISVKGVYNLGFSSYGQGKLKIDLTKTTTQEDVEKKILEWKTKLEEFLVEKEEFEIYIATNPYPKFKRINN